MTTLDQFSKTLGVAADASDDEIHRAYRKLTSLHHPDLGGDKDTFQEIQHAYERLLTLRKRAASDARKAELRRHRAASQTLQRQSPPLRDAAAPTAAPSTKLSASAKKKGRATPRPLACPLGFFTRKLPLQDETTAFIFINVLDIFMTYVLLRFGGIEANPIARYFFHKFGFNGMIFFKLAIVVVVCIIAQIVAQRSMQKARSLLNFGSVLVGAVVVYSFWLFSSKII